MKDTEIHKLILNLFDAYRGMRSDLESDWVDHWTLYCPSAASADYARTQYERVIGEVGNNWRHRLTGTKTFVAVEQLFSLIFTGLFPIEYWIGLEPGAEVLGEEGDELDMELRLLSRFIVQQLEKSQFYTAFSLALRQLIITGNTVFEPYWEDGLKFLTPSTFDIWSDPTQDNPNESNVFRRIVLTPDTVKQNIREGVFNKISIARFEEKLKPTSNDDQIKISYSIDEDGPEKDLVASFFSISRTCDASTIWWSVYEFWGKLYIDGVVKDVYVVFDNDDLYTVDYIESSCGESRPFVLSRYIPVTAGVQPYGLAAVQPAKGISMYLDKMLNQRLDGQELVINPAWGCVEDDILNPETLVIEPGSITPMAAQGNLFPLIQPNLANMNVNAVEMQALSADIDRAYGTVPGIGTSPQRSAERVTAVEVETQRDAGGMRATVYIQHIERDLLIPVITRIIDLLAENLDSLPQAPDYVGIVGLPLNEDKVNYYGIKQKWLEYQSRVVVSGSKHMLERSSTLSGLERLLGFVSKSPEMMQHIDVKEAVRMYLRASQIPDPDRLLVKEQPMQPADQGMPMSASNDLQRNLQFDPEGMAQIGAKLTEGQQPLSSLVQ